MSQAELPVLRVAYMPLIDCAPLVAASRRAVVRSSVFFMGFSWFDV